MNYKHLNLPPNPIKTTFDMNSILPELIKRSGEKAGYVEYNPNEVLTAEVLQIFESVDLLPSIAIMFCVPLPRSKDLALIHSDVESIRHTAWKKVVCSVNWELTPNVSPKFSWYETTRKPVMPEKRCLSREDIKLFGIHYENRRQFGFYPNHDTLIESVNTNTGALLVRTDIPHSIEIDDTSPEFRFAISVRFKNKMQSWDDAVELFKPLIQ